MEIKVKHLIFLLISIVCLGQNQKLNESSKDSIVFVFNRDIYNKIAIDSIKKLYNEQADFYLNKNDANKSNAISVNYKWEDLSFFSIPEFRIKREAIKKYNCQTNIENFIQFLLIYLQSLFPLIFQI